MCIFECMNDQSHRKYMQLAILAAKEAKMDGGVAIGAVLVNNMTGKIIATKGSLVGVTNDPTAHAEVNVIRAASKQLGESDLFDYTLYSTLEPCQMCLSAAAWAKIPYVYFGAYRKDVDPSLFDTKKSIGDEAESTNMNLRENITMQVHGGILENECAMLLGSYREKPRH